MDFPYPVCQLGVKRAHLVDAQLDGGLLLELYSRDGVGTMVSTDFYEGGDGELTHLQMRSSIECTSSVAIEYST